jgi:transposase
LEVLKRLREKVRRKRPELFANNSWILHHDNAPAHTALSVREFLATKQITVLEHPAYSPDLAPNDFFLSPKIKEILKARYFDDIDDTRNNTTAALKAIPQNQFQNCFEGWTGRWHRCIASQGEYFEGVHGGIQQ